MCRGSYGKVHSAPWRNYSANCTRRIIMQSRKYEFRTSVNAKSHVGLEVRGFLTTLARLTMEARKMLDRGPIALGGMPTFYN